MFISSQFEYQLQNHEAVKIRDALACIPNQQAQLLFWSLPCRSFRFITLWPLDVGDNACTCSNVIWFATFKTIRKLSQLHAMCVDKYISSFTYFGEHMMDVCAHTSTRLKIQKIKFFGIWICFFCRNISISFLGINFVANKCYSQMWIGLTLKLLYPRLGSSKWWLSKCSMKQSPAKCIAYLHIL